MKKYPLLDVFRLICACLVALIHKGAPKGRLAYVINNCFTAQAVPFFFIVSGFFFVRKLRQAKDPKAFVLDYAKRILLFYGLWSLLQFPDTLQAYLRLYEGASWIYLAAVLARRILFVGGAPFWYLLALAETALVAGLLLCRGKLRLLAWLGGIGLVLNYLYILDPPLPLLAQFNDLIYTIFSWNNNFLMMGIPFFTIGVLFSEYEDRLRISAGAAAGAYLAVGIVSVGCFALQQTEAELVKYLYLFVPQAVLLFLTGIRAPALALPKLVCSNCRDLSVAIFCLHVWILKEIYGRFIPWSSEYWINYWGIIAACTAIYCVVKLLRIRPLYRLITLK